MNRQRWNRPCARSCEQVCALAWSSRRARHFLKHIRPVIMRNRGPWAEHLQTAMLVGQPDLAVRFPSCCIPVEEQNEAFQSAGQQDMRSAFGAKCRPYGNSMKTHGSKRRFDAFGKSKNGGRSGQLYRAATWTSQHHPRFRQIAGFQASQRIEKGSMDCNEPMSRLTFALS